MYLVSALFNTVMKYLPLNIADSIRQVLSPSTTKYTYLIDLASVIAVPSLWSLFHLIRPSIKKSDITPSNTSDSQFSIAL